MKHGCLLDSNIPIYLINGQLDEHGEQLFSDMMKAGAYISVISRIEILGWQGHTKDSLKVTRDLLQRLIEYPLTSPIAEIDIFGNKKGSRKGRRGRRGRKRESVRSAISGGFALSACFARPILIPILIKRGHRLFPKMSNMYFYTSELSRKASGCDYCRYSTISQFTAYDSKY